MIQIFTKQTLWLAAMLIGTSAFADKIKGRLVDDKNEPIIGATVAIEKTAFGAVSDANGFYEIKNLPAGTYKLKITYIGYQTTYLEVVAIPDNATDVPKTITIKEDAKALDDVVVVGYGTKLKREVTGSIAKINAKELNDMPIPSFESALQAKLPGVQVTTGSGVAGSAAVIRIRGVASISAGGDPLYVVDGIPITQDFFLNNGNSAGNSGGMNNNPLASINPDDIESIDVLKDAAATAIYGSRGSNGVILVTTKRGRKGGFSVSYTGSVGISRPTALPNMLNSTQYLQLYQEAYENDGGVGLAPLPGGISWEQARKTNTDWVDLTTRTGIKNSHSVTISNSGKKGGIYGSVGYSNNESYLVGNRYERISGRLNGDYNITKKLKAGVSTSLSQGTNYRVNTAWAGGLGQAMSTALPIYPVYDSVGNYFSGDNPVKTQELKKWRTTELRSINNIQLDYEIAKGLLATGKYNLDYMQLRDDQYDPQALINSSHLGTANRYATYVTNYSYSLMLNYRRTISRVHSMSLMGAYEFQESRTNSSSVSSNNMTNGFWDDNAGAAEQGRLPKVNPEDGYSFLSYFGRANYDYKKKYFVEFVLRSDWSTKFGANYRYGFFPALSATWVISDEKFFKVPAVSLTKLRMAYGKSGNANIPTNQYLSKWQPAGASTPYYNQPITFPSIIPNPDLRWETSWTFNAGIDIGLFKDRITMTADVYDKRTTDVFMQLALPPSTGFDNYWGNVGSITNRGIEFSITSRNIVGSKFTWTTNFNVSRNWNEITSIGAYSEDAVSGGTNDTRVVVGEPVGTNFLVRFKGIDPANGKPIYLDKDGNETYNWDPKDRVAVGNIQPKAIGGIGNNFRYKNWEMNVLFNFVLGGDIYESSAKRQNGVVTNWNMRTDLFDRWQKPGDQAAYGRLTQNTATYGSSTPWINTTQWIQDGTFLRLRNVTVAYNLPKSACQKIKLSSMRIAVIGTNLLTFTEYTGLDPEIARDFENATDRNMSPNITYLTPPQEKTYTVQLSVNF